jgi:hypothetical protein
MENSKCMSSFLLEPFIHQNREVNLENVLGATDLIEADNEYHVEEVMGSIEKKVKVSYLVTWRGYPAKKD